MPYPAPRTKGLVDLVEQDPVGTKWHTPKETDRLLSLMSPLHAKRVEDAQKRGARIVGLSIGEFDP